MAITADAPGLSEDDGTMTPVSISLPKVVVRLDRMDGNAILLLWWGDSRG